MKHSPYITWAKRQHDVRYNLASSGMPAPSLEKLVDDPAELLKPENHEDGWPPLIQRIARRYEVDFDQIVLTDSASMANHLVCALLLEAGDEVLVEDPAYEPLVSLPTYCRVSVSRFSRTAEYSYQPDPEEIEQLITGETRLIILSDLHNPSGAQLNADFLSGLIRIVETHNIFVLIDEVYLEFLYPEGSRTAAKLSPNIITTRSLTKVYGLDDIRIGWIIAKPDLAARLQRLKDLFSTTLPFPSERLGAAALDRADELLKSNLELLQKNFDLVGDFVESHPQLSWHPPDAGTVGFVRFEGGKVEGLVKRAHKEYGTVVAPGSFFGRADHFRIGWGMPTEDLQEGLRRLDRAIR